MAKYRCVCGETLTFSGEIPHPYQYDFVSDVEYDMYSGLIDAEELYRAMKAFFKCPRCGRLWFFWDGFDRDPVVYARE